MNADNIKKTFERLKKHAPENLSSEKFRRSFEEWIENLKNSPEERERNLYEALKKKYESKEEL